MGKLILILGGARSGKSTYAMELAGSSRKVAYIATAAPADDPEMKQRIEEHKKIRPFHWLIVEEPLNIDKSLVDLEKKVEVAIIDCITLLLTNWLLRGVTKIENLEIKDYLDKEESILEMVKNLARIAKKTALTVMVVSNEVGMGIHPENRLGRYFRDMAGRANRILAEPADEVYFMTAGIPLKIKG
ncbi:bifunctional adenosylcobinamide kinase/adenosylcobinamide-phosphate guanylyltransferase [candidate division WOR-1 bacterium RIFCSPLOWO2_02_FULL_46_20]|uniref:Adenosylcobinamide kinase n=2 Tax=Saganbacteria TaxID=1703751 RepID=A0A1F4REX7_UNCSA|nr:MAG: bifunctional adenosylcobinamide kinase/adenosylcobinamide-phosphate guanylyltransferase [candidate division WOR-1 bacterium RIFCSPHIGHO2_02_FULL_45_12]OGC06063.1 MAG: bifunctional adenosylcobinamide kinase/adenosylcobinamide-phosphate guanylyltransferase [candidate division WOR-1 bacterium RIFCSPLOWO2_02_FULL_46_20]OGC09905.1 MAG: bifunctional adenosylcobinamide kinase/adenosylcobinamide-phosphate guanylyltransferase [candidate division WOR-1 bacterium RIFCSPLOWO2_12_FULL_45_9]